MRASLPDHKAHNGKFAPGTRDSRSAEHLQMGIVAPSVFIQRIKIALSFPQGGAGVFQSLAQHPSYRAMQTGVLLGR